MTQVIIVVQPALKKTPTHNISKLVSTLFKKNCLVFLLFLLYPPHSPVSALQCSISQTEADLPKVGFYVFPLSLDK